MKLFLIGTLLFSGGSAAAMQNEEVREGVTNIYKNVRERVQKRVKEHTFENIRENGFPYPNEERLANLTEEQSIAIISAIDQVNATYDWANMSDEEIKEALLVVQEEMKVLCDELGLEMPDNMLQSRFRKRVNTRTNEVIKTHLLDNLRETGLEYPSEEKLENLTEEQSAALIAQIDEFNATYDWANMTDEEILAAMEVVKEELQTLHEELGFEPIQNRYKRSDRKGNRNQRKSEETDEVIEGTDEV